MGKLRFKEVVQPCAQRFPRTPVYYIRVTLRHQKGKTTCLKKYTFAAPLLRRWRQTDPWGPLASQPSILDLCQAKYEALFKSPRWMLSMVMLAFSEARALTGHVDVDFRRTALIVPCDWV